MGAAKIIPTEAVDLLREHVGRRVLSVCRIERIPRSQLIQDLFLPSASDYFSCAGGDFYIETKKGIWLAIGADSRRQTVLVGQVLGDLTSEASELDYAGREGMIISLDDPTISKVSDASIIGNVITGMDILRIDDGNDRVVNQRGLSIKFSDKELVIGLKIRKQGPSHLGLLAIDDIDPDVFSKIQAIHV